MSNLPGPGEYIPPPRNEAGNRVLFYSALGEDKERGAISSVNNDPPAADNIADIVIDSDGRAEPAVPFAWGDYQPERGYVLDDEIGIGI